LQRRAALADREPGARRRRGSGPVDEFLGTAEALASAVRPVLRPRSWPAQGREVKASYGAGPKCKRVIARSPRGMLGARPAPGRGAAECRGGPVGANRDGFWPPAQNPPSTSGGPRKSKRGRSPVVLAM